jgi:hypothetical protein
MRDPEDFTYRVAWSDEDDAWIATVDEMPSLSWADPDLTAAAVGIRRLVRRIEADRADD